ncbi:hypothetical protein L0Z42_13190 [Burkholderia multivorans]|uniref:hypothetical protein n=1 Tax=Burkholderia multivorans TaxID=87883 RepID=UPI002019F257|nr:hypothetical protein [Burkholderia multivorans]MCO1371493.1 hypothetical protein [Burkholderia multivorans]MCO1457259.1 hypothetical protein [Burkholderia multivorans]MCO1466245.1 hypothetical protein [Burkholderia multivorans]UQO16060.1 hypothetical protein L0Z02_10635 [Burkholderia multivorans]UQO86573.1 hypothetical protein L0Y86_15825 [Burkholderia multivorans]
MKITDDMLTEPPVDPRAPRVEAVIRAVMGRFPGLGKTSQAAYYEEVHQHLAPLARALERENGELRSEIDRLNATIRDQFAARRTTPDRECEWKCDDIDNGIWESSCGESWSFIDGGPVENRMLFCHRCGGKLKTAPTSDQGEKS